MRSRFQLALLAACLMPLTACHLYFYDDDDGGDPCVYPPVQTDSQPVTGIRNPETGQCEYWSGWNPPYPCNDACGPCADWGGAQEPPPDWGFCESFCTGLDEMTCQVSSGCQAIYTQGGPDGGLYMDCWQVAGYGQGAPEPAQCEGLGSYACSRLDTCSASHQFACPEDPIDPSSPQNCVAGEFIACHNEDPAPLGCYGDEQCPGGTTCNAGDICLPPPGSGDCEGQGCDVPTVCYGYCVPTPDPGECDGELLCDMAPPPCPANTIPGIADGCYTGYCLPAQQCEPQACNEVVSESTCIARDDCTPHYQGQDCQCIGDMCTCSEWLFDHCE